MQECQKQVVGHHRVQLRQGGHQVEQDPLHIHGRHIFQNHIRPVEKLHLLSFAPIVELLHATLQKHHLEAQPTRPQHGHQELLPHLQARP